MNRVTAWISRAYVRAVWLVIGPAVLHELKRRDEERKKAAAEWSAGFDALSSAFTTTLAKHNRRRAPQAEGVEPPFSVSAEALAEVETRRLKASELPAAMRPPVPKP